MVANGLELMMIFLPPPRPRPLLVDGAVEQGIAPSTNYAPSSQSTSKGSCVDGQSEVSRSTMPSMLGRTPYGGCKQKTSNHKNRDNRSADRVARLTNSMQDCKKAQTRSRKVDCETAAQTDKSEEC